ncbi:unnamed protein product [Phytophthora lilii]|uniref:Unnamed protein product n=1 Tax=Phytophthora lilii TaxID=2077276 RepID=A0A9W6TM70_9STRA|nr:unnamed protein product [Phytophthora lilii]
MISKKVHDELMSVRRVLHYLPVSPSTEYGWDPHERELFWIALDRYPRGPWTVIAEFIGTKSTRQAMTHGQKLRQKLKRWVTRLHRNPTARSLMDGVTSPAVALPTTSTSGADASETTMISAVVSTPLPEVKTPIGLFDRTISLKTTKDLALSRSDTFPTDTTSYRVVADIPQKHYLDKNLGVKMSNAPVTFQAHGKLTGSRPPEAALCGSSTSLQMLFEPSHPVSESTMIDLNETKDDNAVPHPITEVPIPVGGLLDELADVLWSDHREQE